MSDEILTTRSGHRFKFMEAPYDYVSAYGRSRALVDCPWCGKKGIRVYIWSLAGSGKLCPKCKALLTKRSAFEYVPKARKK